MPRHARTEPDVAAGRLTALRAGRSFPGGWVPEADAPAPEAPVRAASGDLERVRRWLGELRLTASGPSLAALAGACVVGVALVAAVLAWHGRGQPDPAVDAGPPVAAAPPSPPSLVVDVGGRVRHPGLVTLPPGARVADALRAAGGALRRSDLLTLNLAARVADGQLLLVGVPGAASASAADGGGSAPVDLNTATLEQLEALPGVGPVLAQRILDWRAQHGGFRTVGELQDVPGIGDRTYADLRPRVTA